MIFCTGTHFFKSKNEFFIVNSYQKFFLLKNDNRSLEITKK